METCTYGSVASVRNLPSERTARRFALSLWNRQDADNVHSGT